MQDLTLGLFEFKIIKVSKIKVLII